MTGIRSPRAGSVDAPDRRARLEALLRQRAAARRATKLPQAMPAPEDRYEPFPLTDVQQAYWVGRGSTHELGNVAAHFYVELDMPLVIESQRLGDAIGRLIERHDMLRAVVLRDGRQQVLREVPPLTVKRADLRDVGASDRAALLEATRAELSHQIFDTERWPLFEVRVSVIGPRRSRLHLSFDLVIIDFSSLMLFLQEMLRLYLEPARRLPPLHLGFRDYVLAERELRSTEHYTRSRAYWLERLPELPAAPDLPMARAPSTLARPRFVRRVETLPPEDWSRLRARAKVSGVTPSAVLLTAYAHVLGTWARTRSFTLNLTLFNRLPLHREVSRIVGDFTSLNLLAVDPRGGDSFTAAAQRVQSQLWRDLDHRHMSGVEVMRELVRRSGGSLAAPMPVVFTSAVSHEDMKDNISLESEIAYGLTQTPQVWLDHIVAERAGALVLSWDAVDELFPAGLLDEMFAAYCRLVKGLAQDPERWGRELDSVVPGDQVAAQAAVNATAAPAPRSLLHEPFLEQAAGAPDRVALVSGEHVLTYGELANLARGYSRELRDRGVGPGELVAVVMEKGWEQVVAVLAILQAGGAYLPIDPELPAQRLRHLLAHGQVRLALTQPWVDERCDWPPGVERIAVRARGGDVAEELPADGFGGAPSDLAYVIYTSGSTGLPKGVMIEHRAALNTIAAINARFRIGPGDRVLALSSLSFDLSVYDVFGTLACGATIVIPEAAAASDPARWVELVEQEGVTVWNSVPALAQLLVSDRPERSPAALRSLRLVMLSGDWIPLSLPSQIRAAARDAQISSLGGATEASIWSIAYPIDAVEADWPSIPYGRPLANQTCHVLDDALRPRPVGVPGDLYIGGAGVARGYWRDPARTAASFVIDPTTGEPLYRTGDVARWLPDYQIELLGREDLQVKINGNRVELGEIELALADHAAVDQAVVIATGDPRGARRLAAFVVPTAGRSVGQDELRSHLSQRLPAYMVPPSVVTLEALPLTANGKIDRQALAAMHAPARVKAAGYVAPRNAIESALAQMWADVLELDRVGVHDKFLDLGGDSLQAVRLRVKAEDAGYSIEPRELFERQTIAEIADYLGSSAAKARPTRSLVAIQPDGERAPLFCVHPSSGHVAGYLGLARELGPDQPVFGLQWSDRFAPVAAEERIAAMAKHYLAEVRVARPDGPYLLAGMSVGGLVAFEMACGLAAEDAEVGLLAIVDASPADAAAMPSGPAGSDPLLAAAFYGAPTPAASNGDRAVRMARRLDFVPSELSDDDVRRHLEISRLALEASREFHPRFYPGEIQLFRSAARSEASGSLGWEEFCGHVVVHDVPASHFEILAPPAVTLVAERLAARLGATEGVAGGA